jgi:hypothetical protein
MVSSTLLGKLPGRKKVAKSAPKALYIPNFDRGDWITLQARPPRVDFTTRSHTSIIIMSVQDMEVINGSGIWVVNDKTVK